VMVQIDPNQHIHRAVHQILATALPLEWLAMVQLIYHLNQLTLADVIQLKVGVPRLDKHVMARLDLNQLIYQVALQLKAGVQQLEWLVTVQLLLRQLIRMDVIQHQVIAQLLAMPVTVLEL